MGNEQRHVVRPGSSLGRQPADARAGSCAPGRPATAIGSGGSFQGYRLTSDFGASIADSMATAKGWAGTSSGSTSTGVWQVRTKSRVTVNTKSALVAVHLVQEGSTISIVMSGRRAHRARPQRSMLLL